MTDNTSGPVTEARELAPPEKRARTVEVGGRELLIEPVSGRKASRAFAILKRLGKEWPELVKRMGQWQSEYERDNVIELDRAQAEFRFAPMPIVDADGEPVRYPDTIEVDDAVVTHPRAGEVVMVPSRLDHMTEAAWESADNKLRLPKEPSTEERWVAIFPEVLEVAEEHVYELLALFTMSNSDVKAHRKDGTLEDELDRIVDDLLDDADADELLELAVTCGEVVEGQFVAKARALGGRMGNALRLLGLDPSILSSQTEPEEPQTMEEEPEAEAESPATPSSSRPTSSTDSPPSDLAGASTPSSTPSSSSSEPSELALKATVPG